jgi:RNA polymerase sigma factor (sigma-70 family)
VEVTPAAVRHRRLVHLVLNHYFRRQFAALYKHGYAYEDLVQEGLYAILRAESQYNPTVCAESTYYSQVVYNWIASRIVCLNFHRDKRRLNGETLSLDEPTRTAHGDDGPTLGDTLRAYVGVDEDEILDGIMLDRALEHLRAHSENQYRAVKMRFFNDFDNYQIADAMGYSIQNVSLMILNGLEYLRGIYKVDQGGKTA